MEGLPPPENFLDANIAGTKKTNTETSLIVSSNVKDKYLSEDELYEIKQSFEVIETLWRDISFCAEHIQSSVLATIHDSLGELGSEFFRKHFMVNTKQVTQLLLR
jgi:hypothetical protein